MKRPCVRRTTKSTGSAANARQGCHTLITDLAESGAADETIRDIAGHVSKQMLKHYSHIRMAAKRGALEGILAKPKPQEPDKSSAGRSGPSRRTHSAYFAAARREERFGGAAELPPPTT